MPAFGAIHAESAKGKENPKLKNSLDSIVAWLLMETSVI
jgi:hypothetical protein